jgi:hypothetical protein
MVAERAKPFAAHQARLARPERVVGQTAVAHRQPSGHLSLRVLSQTPRSQVSRYPERSVWLAPGG